MGDDGYSTFVADNQKRLWQTLVTTFGPEVSSDAVAEALAYAWERWDRISVMVNPVGYVYRVAQRIARRQRDRANRALDFVIDRNTSGSVDAVDAELVAAMMRLSPKQRTAVFLLIGCGWSAEDASNVMNMSASTVRSHRDRGLAKLRRLRHELEGASG